MLLATMPSLYNILCRAQHTVQGCGAKHAVTSAHAFGDHAQNAGIYCILACLYNIPRKDVEQDTCLQRFRLFARKDEEQDAFSAVSMILATTPQNTGI